MVQATFCFYPWPPDHYSRYPRNNLTQLPNFLMPGTDTAGAGSRQCVSPHGPPRTPAPGPSAALSNTPRTDRCYRRETQEAAERAAALGGPRGDFAPAFARCLRIASTTSWSLINPIILISAPQLGHSNGSTS